MRYVPTNIKLDDNQVPCYEYLAYENLGLLREDTGLSREEAEFISFQRFRDLRLFMDLKFMDILTFYDTSLGIFHFN